MALVGPEPPPSAANPTTGSTTAPNLTLREVSALSDKGEPTNGPGVAEQPPQLCVCCACRSELRRADAFRCSRCRLAFYCSRECQRSYHKRHVRWCKREAGLQAQLRAEHPHALVRTGTPRPPALGLIALCRPQVCSSKLLWHVRRWDASGKETCPDPRYYLRKTADKVPATLSPSELS